MDLEKFLENPKTAYFAETYKKLEKDEASTLEMIQTDPTLKDLAEADLESIKVQKEALWKQMQEIVTEEEKEEEFPNEIILEVRRCWRGRSLAFCHGVSRDVYKVRLKSRLECLQNRRIAFGSWWIQRSFFRNSW